MQINRVNVYHQIYDKVHVCSVYSLTQLSSLFRTPSVRRIHGEQ